MNTREQGARGEGTAAAYLIARGMALITQNLSYRGGEVDLVMRDGRYTVFVEVKQRGMSEQYGLGRQAVTREKQRRISAVALRYLQQNGLVGTPVRFDVVEIQGERVTHLPNAFPYAPPAHRKGFF